MSAWNVAFDSDLMRRYEREGPRYTSYPTAAQFTESIDASAYQQEARAALARRPGNPCHCMYTSHSALRRASTVHATNSSPAD